MSTEGLKAALRFAASLPEFSTYEEAEKFYTDLRERYHHLLRDIATRQSTFVMDFSPESLKTLEKLYFHLQERNLFEDVGTSREAFECCMGFYYGEVVVRNFPGLRWRVQQFGFATNKYELQVVSGRFAEGIGCFRDLFRKPKNRRPWKAFERWASQIELEKRYPVPEKIDLKGELFDEDRTNSLPSY